MHRARFLSPLLALALVACATQTPAPPASPGTQRPSSAPEAAPTLFDSGDATLRPAKGWVLSRTEAIPGVAAWDIRIGAEQRGRFESIDLATWAPSSHEGEGGATDQQEAAFRALLADLATATVLTPAIASRIALEDTGTLISTTQGDVAGLVPIATPAGLVGWSYTMAHGRDPGLMPTYVAIILDATRGRVLRSSWWIHPNEPVLKSANDRIAQARPEDLARVIEEARAQFSELVTGTPRSRLSWGEDLQRVDEFLLSYAPTTEP